MGILSDGLSLWEREAEDASFAGDGSLEPDSSAILLHNALADRQADTAAGVLFAGVQAFEKPENLIRVARLDPDPVVGDRKNPPAVLARRGNLYTGVLLATVLERVAEQILEQLRQVHRVNRQDRQVAAGDFGAGLFDRGAEVLQNTGEDAGGIDGGAGAIGILGGARVGQQIAHQGLHAFGAPQNPAHEFFAIVGEG